MAGFVTHKDGTATLVFDKKAVKTDENGVDSVGYAPARLLFPGPCNPSEMVKYAAKAMAVRPESIQVRDNGDGTYGILQSAQEALGIAPKAPKTSK